LRFRWRKTVLARWLAARSRFQKIGISLAPSRSSLSREHQKIWQFLNYGAAELLNRLRWDSYPEKILLLGAWFEARGGSVPWKSADMDEVFKQAKEKPPANFPRDVKQAIKAAWIHPMTPRTYCVTRTGWNKLAEVLSQ
jgi:hypothetical protein